MPRLAVTACLLLAGCGPIQASSAIADASVALQEAEREDATKYARYEHTKAVALLEQAKVKQGYAEYEIARSWAEQARDLAREAAKAAVRRRDLELRRLNKPVPGRPSPLLPPPSTAPPPGGTR